MSKDVAFDFVAGALSPEERAHLARARHFDPALSEEIDRLEAQLAPLTGLAGEETPAPDLFDRIEAALDRSEVELAGKQVVEFGEGRWLRYRPGIECKRLWNKRTIMLRCRPGAVLPAHEHGQDEHIVVIAGDFVVGGRTFGTGDYHFSPAGNDHGDAFTRGGCVLLIQYAA